MSPEEKLRLTHIAKAAALIADYVNSVTKEAFLSDTLRQDAVIRRIQIIGEAVRHLSNHLLAGVPDFPAKEARGTRNVLVHDNHGPINLYDVNQNVEPMRQIAASIPIRPYSPSL
jgi:uncharacterized protein with HEPN domain